MLLLNFKHLSYIKGLTVVCVALGWHLHVLLFISDEQQDWELFYQEMCCRYKSQASIHYKKGQLYFSPELQLLTTLVSSHKPMSIDMGLWDDTRVVPCNSQLWAIQCNNAIVISTILFVI